MWGREEAREEKETKVGWLQYMGVSTFWSILPGGECELY